MTERPPLREPFPAEVEDTGEPNAAIDIPG